MNIITRYALGFFLLTNLIIYGPIQLYGQQHEASSEPVWISAYLASWNHYVPPGGNWGIMPTEAIDWDAFTHLFYFAFAVEADGSLSKVEPYQNMNEDRLKSIVKAAHKAGRPILFTIGGWGNHDAFVEAMTPRKRSKLVQSVIQMMETWGFDGVDLDLEPIRNHDLDNYRKFIEELYEELQSMDTPLLSIPLLTVATNGQPGFFAEVHPMFDQINLMTYDLSGAWGGWVSWHNAAVYSSRNFPRHNKPLPSVDLVVQSFLEAGVPSSKIGIGIDFYGYVWSGGDGTPTGGVTEPNQPWTTPPAVTDNVPFHEIMDTYYDSARHLWDEEAQAAYLSIDKPGSAQDKFISFDDEQTVRAKFDYISEHQLGGAIIWELTGGYQANQPAGQRDLLLQSVQNALLDLIAERTSAQSSEESE